MGNCCSNDANEGEGNQEANMTKHAMKTSKARGGKLNSQYPIYTIIKA
jgi:hypothetical protein